MNKNAISKRHSNWKKRYTNQLIKRGLEKKFAEETFKAGYYDHDFLSNPEDAADRELSYRVAKECLKSIGLVNNEL